MRDSREHEAHVRRARKQRDVKFGEGQNVLQRDVKFGKGPKTSRIILETMAAETALVIVFSDRTQQLLRSCRRRL